MKSFVLIAAVLFGLSYSTGFAAAPHGEATLALKKLQPAPGLKVELFASEPLLQNPVSISLDNNGRIFVAETHRYKDSIFDITQKPAWLLDDLAFRTPFERASFLQRTFQTKFTLLTNSSELVRLVEDNDHDGHADNSIVVANGFNESISGTAAGVLARGHEAWFANIPDLWHLKLDAKGKAVERKKLATGFGVHIGVTGHDLHGLILGPDGKLYFSIGDRGFKPPPDIKGPGFTTAFLQRVLPDCGAVFRCNPDGSRFEVYCVGLRNPQELTFDSLGNLFTVDNDTGGEDKSRLLYLVEGGDYGWRCSYQHMQGFGPWVKENLWSGSLEDVLPWSGEVSQGPSGLAFNPGTALTERYKDHFFICDFPGGIWSFTVRPRGASYETAGREKFLWSLWPTDIAFGPEGAAYVSDWVEGWTQPDKGRIYRITHPALATNALAAEVKAILAQGLRDTTLERLETLLAHPDMRVRQDAQAELVSRALQQPRPTIAVFERAIARSERLPRLHALWGLRQYAESTSAPASFHLNLNALLKDADAEIRAQTARAFPSLRAHAKADVAGLLAALKDPEPRVRFFAAACLNRLGRDSLRPADEPQEAVQAIRHLILENQDRDAFLTHAAVMALLGNADVETLLRLAQDPQVSVRRAALLSLRRLELPVVARFLDDADLRLVYETARAINDVPLPEAMPSLAAVLSKPGLIHQTNLMSEWTIRRALNAHFRLGMRQNAEALARFSADNAAAETPRVEALELLAEWAKPQPLDRIMGLWRPLPARDVKIARAALQSVIPDILVSSSESVRLAGVQACARLRLTEASPGLLAITTNPTNSPAFRKQALSALGELHAQQLIAAVEKALQDPNLAIRQEAIRWAGGLKGSAAMLGRMLETEKNTALAQAAFATLSNLAQPESVAVLKNWMKKLQAGQVPRELQLDVLEASAAQPALQNAVQDYKAAHSTADPLASWRETLYGGRAEEGRKIFFDRMEVQCLRCHMVKGKGGNVGPALDGLAKKQTREYILESIVLPNDKIAAGFETVSISLKDGRALAGQLKKETDAVLEILSPEDGLLKITKAEIEKRDRGLSAMPDGLAAALSKRELRDLVEYLAGLK